MNIIDKTDGFRTPGGSDKRQIVLADTGNVDVEWFAESLRNKRNVMRPAYVVARNGDVYQLYDDTKFTRFTDDKERDKASILIMLEGEGVCQRDGYTFSDSNGKAVKYVYEYCPSCKGYRGSLYWGMYSEKQIEALRELVEDIKFRHGMPLYWYPDFGSQQVSRYALEGRPGVFLMGALTPEPMGAHPQSELRKMIKHLCE